MRRFKSTNGRTVTTYNEWVFDLNAHDMNDVRRVIKADPAGVALNYVRYGELYGKWLALLAWIAFYKNYISVSQQDFVEWAD